MDLVTDAALLATSIVAHPLEIAASLRRLNRRQTPVFYHPSNSDTSWSSTLHSMDDARRELRIFAPRIASRSDADAVRLSAAAGGILVSELDGARVQFMLDRFEPQRQAEGWVLAGTLPTRAWRLQRRAAFRVRPFQETGALVRVRTPHGLVDWQIEDISETGLRIRLTDEAAFPAPGTRWANVFMEIPNVELLRADLEVRWALTRSARRGVASARWVGSALAGLDADQAQQLRRWIQEQQVQLALSRRLDEAVS
jgi:c-di-GMP-binding flagellar brake protein YcgR